MRKEENDDGCLKYGCGLWAFFSLMVIVGWSVEDRYGIDARIFISIPVICGIAMVIYYLIKSLKESKINKEEKRKKDLRIQREEEYRKSTQRIFTYVAGVTFENRQEIISNIQGNTLLLVREEDNPYDENAIAVYYVDRQNLKNSTMEKVGYLPADIAKQVVGYFGSQSYNHSKEAKIEEIHKTENKVWGIKISFVPPNDSDLWNDIFVRPY